MKITVDEKLKEYMNESGYEDLIVQAHMCSSWGGSFMDISARFADKTFSPDPSQYSTEITDIGKVYLPKRGVSYAKEVKLSLLKVLWMKKITVTGVYALQ